MINLLALVEKEIITFGNQQRQGLDSRTGDNTRRGRGGLLQKEDMNSGFKRELGGRTGDNTRRGRGLSVNNTNKGMGVNILRFYYF